MKLTGYKSVKKEGFFDEFTFGVASDENGGSIRLVNRKTGENQLVKSLEVFGLGEALYRRVVKNGIKNVYMPLTPSYYKGEGDLYLYLPCISSDYQFVIMIIKSFGYSRFINYVNNNNNEFGFTKIIVKQYKNTKSFYAYDFEPAKEFSLDIPKSLEDIVNKYLRKYSKVVEDFEKSDNNNFEEIGI